MIIKNIRQAIAEMIYPSQKIYNKFTQAFSQFTGISFSAYAESKETYIDKGYNFNPVVFSVINAQAEKIKNIPYNVKKVKDNSARKRLINSYKDYSVKGLLKTKALYNQAYEEEIIPFPMKNPNPIQSWNDIKSLYVTFLILTGDFYLYKLKGDFSNEPEQVYVLPSHMMKIVLKDSASMMGNESPIDGYMLISNGKFIEFDLDEIIHIKTPNPNYSANGDHLYGQSKLRAALRNLQGSNEAIDNNNRTLRNSGAFGFITGKGTALTQDQAETMKARLEDMRSDTSALGQIAGASSELNFTRISLTTDELKPFDYLMFDEKQICNVLGWDNKLLNNDSASTYDNLKVAQKRVLTDTIMPIVKMFDDMITDKFLPLFKGYENTVCEHDYKDLPEMQEDVGELVKWLSVALSDGAITRDEYREIIGLPETGDADMSAHTVNMGVIKLSDALNDDLL